MAKHLDKIPAAEILGENLQYLREKENLNRDVFAKLISYNRNTLSELEQGYQNIKLSTTVRIAKKLNKDVAMLFDISFKDDAEMCQNKEFIEGDYMKFFTQNAAKLIEQKHIARTDISESDHREKVSRILHGHCNDATIKTLDEIARGLATPLSKLLIKED
jgi:transcriptional regulator with XRE-family HTH domain